MRNSEFGTFIQCGIRNAECGIREAERGTRTHMNYLNIIIIAFGLSMDAFSVAFSRGLSNRKNPLRDGLLLGSFFGGFQGVMPFIGYSVIALLASQWKEYIERFSHWIAFVLLLVIGLKFIKEYFDKDDNDEDGKSSLSIKMLFILAVATSIDALAVGFTFPAIGIHIFGQAIIACLIFAFVTFLFTITGFYIGRKAGKFAGGKADIIGGVALILIGIKILVEGI